jgi:DNA-directed RNA polymerase subunit RPC12/RpoP
MRVEDHPDLVCPECVNHSPLTYLTSATAAHAYRPGDTWDTKSAPIHFYVCMTCQQQFMATDGGTGPVKSPGNQRPAQGSKDCPRCGHQMAVSKVPVGERQSGAREFGKPTNRPEMVEVWLCKECGNTAEFRKTDRAFI